MRGRHDIINVIVKEIEIIRREQRIRELPYIQIRPYISDELTHERVRDACPIVSERGPFITGRVYCYCIKGRQASLANEQVKLQDKIVLWYEQSCTGFIVVGLD